MYKNVLFDFSSIYTYRIPVKILSIDWTYRMHPASLLTLNYHRSDSELGYTCFVSTLVPTPILD